jgi:hypothetical protein
MVASFGSVTLITIDQLYLHQWQIVQGLSQFCNRHCSTPEIINVQQSVRMAAALGLARQSPCSNAWLEDVTCMISLVGMGCSVSRLGQEEYKKKKQERRRRRSQTRSFGGGTGVASPVIGTPGVVCNFKDRIVDRLQNLHRAHGACHHSVVVYCLPGDLRLVPGAQSCRPKPSRAPYLRAGYTIDQVMADCGVALDTCVATQRVTYLKSYNCP